jgi:transcriptional regulator with XRE-family HTH domain
VAGEAAVTTADEAAVVIHDRARHAEYFELDEQTGCWLCHDTGPSGAGPFVAFYEGAFGPVPEGFEVVHICHGAQRGCVRPSHLDVVPLGGRARRVHDPALALDHRPDFAKALRDEREAMGASRTDFAKLLKVSPATLRSWEEGTRAPGVSAVAAISRKLGWDGGQRPFVVTIVVQRVARARSAGKAAREVLEQLRFEDQPLRAHVYSVRRADTKRRVSDEMLRES